MRRLAAAVLGLLAGCTPSREVGTPDDACTDYPPDAVRPMELDGVLYPYAWPVAKRLSDGLEAPLDLGHAPCASSPDIDWSPFDVLLFVSIPAW